MLKPHELRVGVKYRRVDGPMMDILNSPFIVESMKITQEPGWVRVSARFDDGKTYAFTNQYNRFEEINPLKDKRWITRQLIAMI